MNLPPVNNSPPIIIENQQKPPKTPLIVRVAEDCEKYEQKPVWCKAYRMNFITWLVTPIGTATTSHTASNVSPSAPPSTTTS